MTHANYHIFSSNGLSLNFVTKEEREEYMQASELFEVQIYAKLRVKYGVWDPEQNKYIPETEDYTQYDGNPPIMEQLYQDYKAKGLA